MTLDKDLILGQSYVCPACGKTFVATTEHRYIICGGFVCSWKCFITTARNIEKTKKEASNKQQV